MYKNAYFAGGCFWCITPTFSEVEGIIDVCSGYSGGNVQNPHYEEVKAQNTGHRETIKITYNPSVITYAQLLNRFLKSVDPFDGGGQYIDRGFSYTLAIFYENDQEKKTAEVMILKLEKESKKKVWISLEPFQTFFKAEEYHQNYYKKNPEAFEKEWENSGRPIIKL